MPTEVAISNADMWVLATVVWGVGMSFAFVWIGVSWCVRLFTDNSGAVSE